MGKPVTQLKSHINFNFNNLSMVETKDLLLKLEIKIEIPQDIIPEAN